MSGYLFRHRLRKVLQPAAASSGAPDEGGAVYLIDDRFAQPNGQRLLPTWWQCERPRKEGEEARGLTRAAAVKST
jgi:hypothetical protein